MTQKVNVFPKLRFHYGYAFSDELSFIAGRASEDQEEDDGTTAIMAFEYKRPKGQQWSFYAFSPDKARSMGTMRKGDANVRFLTNASSQLFYMNQSLEQDMTIQSYRVKTIDGVTFSAGVSPRIYRSIDGGAWEFLTEEWNRKFREYLDYASKNNIYKWPSEISRTKGMVAFDGLDSADVYFAGDAGGVAHYDGKEVKLLPAFTDDDLFGVYARAPGDIWICAHAGPIFRGDKDRGFRFFASKPEFSAVFAMIEYKGKMYVSASIGVESPSIYVLDDSTFRRIDTQGGPSVDKIITFNIADGVLWIFGVDAVLRYDGATWEIMDNPYK